LLSDTEAFLKNTILKHPGKIGEISTTTCQWVTIHLLDKTCEMNGMCRETVVRVFSRDEPAAEV
jgi:hypothetical protein